MNLGNIFPGLGADFWQKARRMGQLGQWLEMEKWDGQRTVFRIRESLWQYADPREREAWKKLLQLRKSTEGGLPLPDGNGRQEAVNRDVNWSRLSGLHLVWTEAFSRLAADGPKMFRPTFEQCEAMEQVAIKVPIPDYHQPYPAMIIEFPREYRELLNRRYNYSRPEGKDSPRREVPSHLIIRHYADVPAIFTGATFEGIGEDLSYFFQARPEFPDIESALRTHIQQEEAEEGISETFSRVAINLMLLLTNHPLTCVPSNPAFLELSRQRMRKRPDIAANRTEVDTHVYVVATQQEIRVRREMTRQEAAEVEVEEDKTGRRLKPHWRKGYWRRPRGQGQNPEAPRTELVRPCFVKGRNFRGDLGDTSATYIG